MFGIQYIKFYPTSYVIHFKNGKIKKEGRGLSFFYYAPSSSIISIPMGSMDIPFIYTVVTKDFQSVTLQGQLTYAVEKPGILANLLDFSTDRKGNHLKNDLDKLNQRLINQTQAIAVSFCQSLSMKESIRSVKQIEDKINESIANSDVVQMLGVKILSVNVMEVKATPEMSKALEAETREALQQESDEAIYKRRNFSVEQERKIKESELNTEIAVEEKKKQIAEKKMEIEILKQENERKLRELKIDTDIEIEKRKKMLIEENSENIKKEADANGYATRVNLAPYKEMDWKTLLAIADDGKNPALNIAIAFRELSGSAGKIENLNITPDLLNAVLQNAPKAK